MLNPTKLSLLLWVVWLLVLSGCRPPISARLQQAEEWMWTHPDSSLQLLESLPNAHQLTGEAQARYALLLTQARYRCYQPATSDSLITLATDYYASHNQADKAGWAYYLKGCLWSDDLNDNVKAMSSYKEAESYIPRMSNRLIIGRIYSNIALLNLRTGNYQLSDSYYRKAFAIHQAEKDTSLMLSNLTHHITLFRLLEQSDSIDWCIDRMHSYLPSITDTALIASAYLNIGSALKSQKRYAEAERHLSLSLRYARSESTRQKVWLNMADIYYETGSTDRADSIFLHISQDPNPFVRSGTFYELIDHKLGILSPSLQKRFRQYAVYTEKAHQQLRGTHLAELQHKYDQTLLHAQNYRLYNRWLTALVFILLLIILLPLSLYLYAQKKSKEIYTLRKEIMVLENKLTQKDQDNFDISNSELSLLIKKREQLEKQIKRTQNIIKLRYNVEDDKLINAYNTYYILKNHYVYNYTTDRVNIAHWLNLSMNHFSDKLSTRISNLKDHQLDVCYLAAIGFSVDEIVKTIGIARASIRRYMSHICKEAGLENGGIKAFYSLIEEIKLSKP